MRFADGTLVREVVSELEKNERIDHALPKWGRLHIDHQQPFLCVYRRPAERRDRGTASLVSGQASVLMASGNLERQSFVGGLSDSILHFLKDVFGAVLLIEVWTSPAPAEDNETDDTPSPKPIGFCIHAPSQYAPSRTLETFERAIHAADWPGGPPKVEVRYEDDFSPHGMAPIVTVEKRRANIVPLGLEVFANYQDPSSGDFYPLILRGVRHALTHVLREAVFSFSHSETKFRPKHFHELGPGSIEEKVFDVDVRLGRVNDAYDLLLSLTPVNIDQAWAEFQCSDFSITPEFHYRPLPFDPSVLKHDLFHIPFDDIGDPALHELFAEKRDETDRHLTLLGERGRKTFLYDSLSLYGPPEPSLVAQAQAIAKITVNAPPAKASSLGSKAFAAHAEKEIARYVDKGLSKDLKVEVRDDVAGLLVVDGNFLISSSARVSEKRVVAALHHEIGTHVVTFNNGRAQPFQLFHTGTAHYEDLQEGLAVFSEYLCNGLTAQRLHQIACRVLAIECLRDGASFVDTHGVLQKEYGLGAYGAFMMTMRLFRGGGLTKDVVYLRGLLKLLDYLGTGGDIEPLYVGKLALHQHNLCQELALRGMLNPPAVLPRYLEDAECLSRLEAARQAESVLALLEEAVT